MRQWCVISVYVRFFTLQNYLQLAKLFFRFKAICVQMVLGLVKFSLILHIFVSKAHYSQQLWIYIYSFFCPKCSRTTLLVLAGVLRLCWDANISRLNSSKYQEIKHNWFLLEKRVFHQFRKILFPLKNFGHK